MSAKRMVSGVGLLALALLMIGCCTEERCKSEHPLYSTKEECQTAFDLPEEPSTPIIILEPSSTYANYLEWKVDGSLVSDNSTSIFNPTVGCKLRFDFLGRALQAFEFTDSSNQTKQAVNVYVSSTGAKISIHNGSPGGSYWSIINQANPLQSCPQIYPGPIPANNSLPPELRYLKKESLEGDDGTGKEAAIKFKMITEIP